VWDYLRNRGTASAAEFGDRKALPASETTRMAGNAGTADLCRKVRGPILGTKRCSFPIFGKLDGGDVGEENWTCRPGTVPVDIRCGIGDDGVALKVVQVIIVGAGWVPTRRRVSERIR